MNSGTVINPSHGIISSLRTHVSNTTLPSSHGGILLTCFLAHVKPFDGGRTVDEKKLFADVRERYTNLKEVKATSDKEGNFAARDRGRYRYM